MKPSTYPHELIGEEIEVIGAKNKSLLGLHAVIIDETKFSLVVEKKITKTKNSVQNNAENSTPKKRLLKEGLTFKLLKSNRVIEGTSIKKRSEERIKG